MITVVGIGADGWDGLAPASRRALTAADVLIGSRRQLGLVPEPGPPPDGGPVTAERVPLPSPLLPNLPPLLESLAGREICVLASGDPMFHGIGSTLVRLLGPGHVRVLPHVSSVSLACARLGWPVERVEVVSLVGRPVAALRAALAPGRRLLVLGGSPEVVVSVLEEGGYHPSRVTVLSDLGSPAESIRPAGEAAPSALSVIAVECAPVPGSEHPAPVPGLPDEMFEHDGQLTKREVRAVVLSRLAPLPGELLWDVGAGAGSIAIEWTRTHPSCAAVAIERTPARAERIRRNADTLGAAGIDVVEGEAPAALDGLPTPGAVFVGGGATAPGMIETCWSALRPGGRLVVTAVTLETEALLAGWYGRLGGDLVRLAVQRAAPVGGFTGWRPAMPVTIWSITRKDAP